MMICLRTDKYGMLVNSKMVKLETLKKLKLLQILEKQWKNPLKARMYIYRIPYKTRYEKALKKAARQKSASIVICDFNEKDHGTKKDAKEESEHMEKFLVFADGRMALSIQEIVEDKPPPVSVSDVDMKRLISLLEDKSSDAS